MFDLKGTTEDIEMDFKVLLSFTLMICLCQAFEENYCDPTLCEDSFTHTACAHYLVKKIFREALSH